MPATTRPLFEQIDSWLQEIDGSKTASARPATSKSAGVKTATPGVGKTTHPSEDVDNDTHPASEGARGKENEEDVKKQEGPPSVDSAEEGVTTDADSKNMDIGLHQSSVGKDSSIEEDYKGTKDDPGTSSPVNAEDVGPKYGSLHLKQLLKVAEDKAHDLLADLSNELISNTPAAQQPQTVQQKAAAVKAAAPATTQTATGYDAATAAVELEKLAADYIAQTIREAEVDADLVGSFLHSYQQTRMKKADEDGEGGDADGGDANGGDAGGDTEAPPSGDAGGGADVLSQLGGGGGGGSPADAGAGAPPPPGGGLAGDPAAAGPGQGDASGGMSQEQALQELAMALQELGISPEELAQIAQSGGAGGAPGGMPGGAPGGAPMAPPPAPDAAAEGAKIASAVKRFKLAGKFRFTEAKTAAQRQVRDQFKNYILELTGNRF